MGALRASLIATLPTGGSGSERILPRPVTNAISIYSGVIDVQLMLLVASATLGELL